MRKDFFVNDFFVLSVQRKIKKLLISQYATYLKNKKYCVRCHAFPFIEKEIDEKK